MASTGSRRAVHFPCEPCGADGVHHLFVGSVLVSMLRPRLRDMAAEFITVRGAGDDRRLLARQCPASTGDLASLWPRRDRRALFVAPPGGVLAGIESRWHPGAVRYWVLGANTGRSMSNGDQPSARLVARKTRRICWVDPATIDEHVSAARSGPGRASFNQELR